MGSYTSEAARLAMLLPTNFKRLDDAFVAHIASLLDQAGIWNVLRGNHFLSIFGVPTYVEVSQPYCTAPSKPLISDFRMPHLLYSMALCLPRLLPFEKLGWLNALHLIPVSTLVQVYVPRLQHPHTFVSI